jgi:hypothetical protein
MIFQKEFANSDNSDYLEKFLKFKGKDNFTFQNGYRYN